MGVSNENRSGVGDLTALGFFPQAGRHPNTQTDEDDGTNHEIDAGEWNILRGHSDAVTVEAEHHSGNADEHTEH